MIRMRRIRRAIRIQNQFLKYGLDEFFKGTSLNKYALLLKLLQPWLFFISNKEGRGDRIRFAMQNLGPVFVKFGQMLSTRKDMFPEDITAALSLLQDKVTPFAGELAIEIVEQTYQKPLSQVFASFEIEPLASASIAQVHAATLKNGEEVVVKILRPEVKRSIRRDLDLLQVLAKLIHHGYQDARRLRLPEVVADYRKTIFDELDLRREAANAAQLKRHFDNSSDLYIPAIHWDYCYQNLMVMERIYAVSVSDLEALKKASVNMERLAEKGVEVFFTQVFKYNFFHADMHPGNIFVDVSNPQDPKYVGVDFGIIGTLTSADQRYLAENFVAFFNRDYHRVAQLHLDSGWVPPQTPVHEFEAAIRTVCEPIFGRPLNEISFAQFLIELFQVARRFDMEVQPQLVLLQKTLLYVEGLGRQLYPELDLWKTAKPFLENWLRERMGPKQLFAEIKKQIPYWREKLPELPQLFYDSMESLPKLPTMIERLNQSLEHQTQMAQRKKRFIFGISFAVTTTLSAVLLQFSTLNQATPWIAGVAFFGWIVTAITSWKG